EIITLYEGAQYHLYLYKRYTDVRLVMAPEKSIAFLGGDQDNFEYPRYCLDKCFFRVYEHEKPLQVEHYFPWSPTGPVEGELLIVAGHPGKTRRMWSADHLRFFQEVEIPLVHQFLQERLQMLKRFAATSPEHARIAGHSISKVSNAHKVYQGLKQNLGEKERDLFERREALLCRFGMGEKDSPWSLLKESLEETKKYIREFFVLEGMGSHYCKLYGLAKTFVRLAQEKQLPSEKRLLEYTDPYLEKLERELLSQEPIYPEFEAICLEEGLERVKAILGRAHPLLQASILEESPQGILQGSKMHSLEDRTFLFHHLDEVLSSQDPLLVLAREMDPYARTLRKEKEDKLEATQHECYANIAQKALDFYGVSLYPDATFSLRLSYGQMKGYQDVCSMTTLEGMQRKSELPASWRGENFLKVNPKIGLNFVSTHDTIGGNSGSPVLNARGEWVGLVFDGNAHSIAWSYLFDDALGRTISVHSEGMMEALEKIYQAYALTEEIRGAVNL
ncbi:MAG: S46 family peptidase, partial [Chlamydiae bacterium]|nr:S46 family peptidase [Chlamydiota bacterium]